MALISSVLGDYTYQFISLTSSLPIILLSMLLFSWNMDKRKHFFLRLSMGFLVCFGLYLAMAILRTHVNTIATRFLGNFLSYFAVLPLLFFCFQEPRVNILTNWCAGVAVQDIAGRIFTILIAIAGNDYTKTISLFQNPSDGRDWLIMYIIEVAVVLLLFFRFRHAKCLDSDARTIKLVAQLSVFFALWELIVHSYSRQYMLESNKLYLTVTVICATFSFAVLILRNGILSANQYRQEIAMAEKLMKEERKLYDSMKENIEIVNMRCHDLKHQLDDLSFKLTEEETLRLKNALKFYDDSVKTGCEALDIALYEKQLIFSKENIRFSVMADGSQLGFMRTTHIYSLFSNALGNALEAVRKLPDPEMRIIDLVVARKNGCLDVSVTNYFNGELLPGNATTKADRAHHGLGIKSMIYIAELYGGTLHTSENGPIFELNLRIPIPQD